MTPRNGTSRAPNVLVVVLDEVGFGAPSAFGGPCQTRNFDKLARNGLTYSRFHTTALGSPRLLSNTVSPLARALKLGGYSTAQFGRCHRLPFWQTSRLGSLDPSPARGGGFDYFYGFIGGETGQWYPTLFEGATRATGTTPMEGCHFTAEMTRKAIAWVRQHKALTPERPFFAYFAPGATQAPHHVPSEWADRYKGRFDHGWDKLREEIFARQKALGVIPRDTRLAPRHAQVAAWQTISAEMKPVLARQMELYAGFVEHGDYFVGRLIDTIDELGALDDTLVYLIIGNNVAFAEASVQASGRVGKLGGAEGHAVGWAQAVSTPHRCNKQIAGPSRGVRGACVVHWPNGMKARGEIRRQLHHLNDVAPTILQAAGLGELASNDRAQERANEGVSMVYSFEDAKAAEQREPQYLEVTGAP
jgi:arylsulfatase A-like enzyme